MGRERKEESGSRIKREQNGDGDRNEEKNGGWKKKDEKKKWKMEVGWTREKNVSARWLAVQLAASSR